MRSLNFAHVRIERDFHDARHIPRSMVGLEKICTRAMKASEQEGKRQDGHTTNIGLFWYVVSQDV